MKNMSFIHKVRCLKTLSGGYDPWLIPCLPAGSGPVLTSRQLDVRVVKAVQLGGAGGKCLEPYVVLEVTIVTHHDTHDTKPP